MRCHQPVMSVCLPGGSTWSSPHVNPMRRRWNNPWIDGDDVDPFLALLTGLALGAVLAAVIILLR